MSFNKKILNYSIVISLLTAYILPCNSSDGFAFDYGYPIEFFTKYNKEITSNESILTSTALNLGALIGNILIIYFIIYIIIKIKNNIKTKKYSGLI